MCRVNFNPSVPDLLQASFSVLLYFMQRCICDYCFHYSDITVLEAVFLVLKMSLFLPSSGNGNTHESFIKARPPQSTPQALLQLGIIS